MSSFVVRRDAGTNHTLKEDRRKEMSPLHNDEKEEMLEVGRDQMWNLNNGFGIVDSVRW